MAVTIQGVSALLASGGIRHHVDDEDRSIRVVVVTRRYRNPRSEKLAILRIDTAGAGGRCRVSLDRAYVAARGAAAVCLTLCRAIADVPMAAVAYDPGSKALRLRAEIPVEDGDLAPGQLFALIDAVVEAAETGQVAIEAGRAAADGGSRHAA